MHDNDILPDLVIASSQKASDSLLQNLPSPEFVFESKDAWRLRTHSSTLADNMAEAVDLNFYRKKVRLTLQSRGQSNEMQM